MKMVVELEAENICLRKMSYALVSDDDLCDEVATLKAKIEVLEAKLRDSMLEQEKKQKRRKYTNFY